MLLPARPWSLGGRCGEERHVGGEPAREAQERELAGIADVADLTELARLLRRLRRRFARQRGESQPTYRELAARTGWSRAAIGEYLSGQTLPPTDRFEVLVQLLGASAAE
jgi:transcriptional regulator with XRE-family HTH domain